MGLCCVYGCNNRTDRHRKAGVGFHRFPKDEALKAMWIKAVHRLNWQPSTNSLICTEHFSSEFVNRTYMSGPKLRENAVPSLFPTYPKHLQPPPVKNRKQPALPVATSHSVQNEVVKTKEVPVAKEVPVQIPKQPVLPVASSHLVLCVQNDLVKTKEEPVSKEVPVQIPKQPVLPVASSHLVLCVQNDLVKTKEESVSKEVPVQMHNQPALPVASSHFVLCVQNDLVKTKKGRLLSKEVAVQVEEMHDLKTEIKRLAWQLEGANQKLKLKSTALRRLRKHNSRLTARVSSLKSVIQMLKANNLVAEECAMELHLQKELFFRSTRRIEALINQLKNVLL